MGDIEGKRICLFDKGYIAYINTDILNYEANKNYDRDEMVANIPAFFVMGCYVFYFIKNSDCFLYEVKNGR